MRANWKEYLAFSQKNRVGAFVMVILIIIAFAVVFFYPPTDQQPVTLTTLNEELAKQGVDTTAAADDLIAYQPSDGDEIINTSRGELFQFDPNTLDAAGFKKLGLRDKTINTIINYRNKGGQFRKPDDLRKIYGLHPEEADRLIPYIQIAGQQSPFDNTNKGQNSYVKPKPNPIDINAATVEQWKSLPAIGDVLANRIVKFREKIGGFTTIAQVKQTYGLSDSAFGAIAPYLRIAAIPVKTEAVTLQQTKTTQPQKAAPAGKININTASVNQLKSNPHIPESVAQAIVIYRSQHGNYSSIEEVKKIVFINEEMYKQIAPYLTAE